MRRSSGQSQWEFAKAKGVPESTLSRWARVFPEPEPEKDLATQAAALPAFVEVVAAVGGAAVAAPGPVVRLMVGAAVAEFGELPPPEYLAADGLFAEGARR